MTTVAVNFLTYAPSIDHPRVAYAQQCLHSLVKNLTFNEGELVWHIADDGSPEEHVNQLAKILMEKNIVPTFSNSNHTGYGGNYNEATQTIHGIADIVLPIEEDWELVKRFDISGLVRALNENTEGMECIRLGYLGWTNTLAGRLIQTANQTFLLFDPEWSDETHVFAGHPRLETVKFEKRVGEWRIGIKAGFTEMEVCNRPEARKGVAWPLDADVNASQDYCSLFAHIGNVQAE